MGVGNRAMDKDQGGGKLSFFIVGPWTGSAGPPLLFSFVGGFSSTGRLKDVLCIFLEEEPGPCPKPALLFLDFSSPIINSLNLPFGTQRRPWRLKLIP